MRRRTFLATSAASSLIGSGLASHARAGGLPRFESESAADLRQSVCRWCYNGVELNELCKRAAEYGYKSVELLSENEWSIPAKHGLTCAVANGPVSIGAGINRLDSHDKFVADCERLIPLVANAKIPQMIVFSGNRRGMPDDEGMDNCATALKRIMSLAEKHKIHIIMELLNSRVDHRDYMCDRTPWGVELVKKVGSDRFKLLYDIYHMQIMEGDVIRTIRDNRDYIGHYHTGGVPGRREIDETQELYYPAICRAIADTGFDGYLGQEFIPAKDPMTSLRTAHRICSPAPVGQRSTGR